jgi:hypothetical protein
VIGAFGNGRHKALQRLKQSQRQSQLARMVNQQLMSPARKLAHNLQQANQLAWLGQDDTDWQDMGTYGTAQAVSTATNYYITSSTSSTSTTTVSSSTGMVNIPVATLQALTGVRARNVRFADGQDGAIELPDGTKIDVKADGSYQIIDKDAKIVYRANRLREFNTFLNASDKLEDFIRYCGEYGVRRDDMLQLPVKLFVAWLAVEAAKADEEPEPPIPLIPDLRKAAAPRCGGCGRFMRPELVRKQILYCAPKCFERVYAREVPQLEAA